MGHNSQQITLTLFFQFCISPCQQLQQQPANWNYNQKLSHFKVPKHILVVDDFPRTASGKVRKVALKEMARRHFDLKENRDEEGMQI